MYGAREIGHAAGDPGCSSGRVLGKRIPAGRTAQHRQGSRRDHRRPLWVLWQQEALFEALVDRQYKYIMSRYRKAQENFTRIPPAKQPDHMGDISAQCMMDLLLYAYDHLKACQLLLCRAEGTRFAHMVDEMVAIEVQGTHEYLQVLSQLGRSAPAIDPKLEHILITGMFNAYFELVLHKMPLEQAKAYLNELHVFYAAGWMKIMGQCPHNFSRIS